MDSIILVGVVVVAAVLLFSLFFSFVPVALWISALAANVRVGIITLIGMQFGALLGGAIVTEAVFSMPGLGSYMINGIKGKDIPVVLSSVVVMAVSFCLVMLAVDLIYAFIDPRIKSKYAKKKR